MEPEGSSPYSHEPYPEPDQYSPYHTILPRNHFNIILEARVKVEIKVSPGVKNCR